MENESYPESNLKATNERLTHPTYLAAGPTAQECWRAFKRITIMENETSPEVTRSYTTQVRCVRYTQAIAGCQLRFGLFHIYLGVAVGTMPRFNHTCGTRKEIPT